MNKGDVVKIVKQSARCNPHIRNMGYIGVIDDLSESAVQLDIFWDSNNSMRLNAGGAVDIDCVEIVNVDELTFNQQCCLYLNWAWKTHHGQT